MIGVRREECTRCISYRRIFPCKCRTNFDLHFLVLNNCKTDCFLLYITFYRKEICEFLDERIQLAADGVNRCV
jgi:hypothetical protein